MVILDPLSNFSSVGSYNEVMSTLLRLVDYFKSRRVTAFCTSLTSNGGGVAHVAHLGGMLFGWLYLRGPTPWRGWRGFRFRNPFRGMRDRWRRERLPMCCTWSEAA